MQPSSAVLPKNNIDFCLEYSRRFYTKSGGFSVAENEHGGACFALLREWLFEEIGQQWTIYSVSQNIQRVPGRGVTIFSDF